MQRPASPQLVTLGLHIVDVLGRPVTRIPPGQEVELIEEITITVAGTAAATAVDAARLGVRVATIGAVGEDVMGTFMKDFMKAEGIDCTHLTPHDVVQTSATILPIRPDGGRPPLHVIGASAQLRAEAVPWDVVSQAKVLHVGGTGLLPALDGQPTAEVLQEAKRLGLTTTMDFIPTKDPAFADQLAACLPHVDHVLPNLEDACSVARTSERTTAINWFHDHGVGCTVLTMGADGVSVHPAGQGETLLPAYDVEVVDTTGCGDAFSAGYITLLLEGATPVQAAELGLAAGSLLATGLGSQAGLVDRAGLRSFAAVTPRKAALSPG